MKKKHSRIHIFKCPFFQVYPMTPHSFSCFLGSNAIVWWLESPWKLRLSSVKDIFNAYQAAETALGHLPWRMWRWNVTLCVPWGNAGDHGEKGDVSRDLTIKHGDLGNKKRGDDGDIIRDITGWVGKIHVLQIFPWTFKQHILNLSWISKGLRVQGPQLGGMGHEMWTIDGTDQARGLRGPGFGKMGP